MALFASIFSVVAGIFFVYQLYRWLRGAEFQSANLPPGPKGFPIFGSVHMMESAFHLGLQKLSKKYGDVFSIYFGPCLTIVLGDVPTIRTVLADERCADRPKLFLFQVTDRKKGLSLSNGHFWQVQRRFALSTLRDLGMGKTWLQDMILEQVAESITILRRTEATPFSPKIMLGQAVANVVCGICFGRRFEHNDPKFDRLLRLFTENNLLAGVNSPMQVFPWLRLIPFSKFRRDYLALTKNIQELEAFIWTLIERPKENSEKNEEEVKHYAKAFLERQAQEKEDPRTTFDDEQLIISVRTLFGAGTDTTAGTLCWILVYMVEHPEVLSKVQTEIDAVVGSSQFVTMEHKADLPFTEATIMEAQRKSPAVPATGRGLNDDMKLPNGYVLPKGCHVAVNMYGVHHDPRYFADPEAFRPERFMNEQGKVFQPDGFMPFGTVTGRWIDSFSNTFGAEILAKLSKKQLLPPVVMFFSGKRQCVGMTLARMELYLFFANIAKEFDITAAPGADVSSKNVTFGQANIPTVTDFVFTPRKLF